MIYIKKFESFINEKLGFKINIDDNKRNELLVIKNL
jgi:hypothetical protein